ncbi:MAG TPA: glucoamylase family protein [Anaerolineales bacterium]|nr:glucoamylase family protein [Anaerolineales bacterium]
MNKRSSLGLVLALALAACASPAAPTPTVAAPQATVTQAAVTPPFTPIPTGTLVVPETVVPTATPVDIRAIIAAEMRGCFDFFWELANTEPGSAGYGLIRDRYPGSEGIASIASVGFGLTAYLVGVEKGYITYEEGFERANGTLDTLLSMERTEGFFYHFVSMQTGRRAWESEVSSIDTAILMMGVLSAGQYFGGEVRDKADQLHAEVNWPWFLDESRDMFHMAYRPDEGFAGHWDFYAEQLMLYVLSAGSDTYPVDQTPYYTFTRHEARFGEGDLFIHSWFGSIFTYQYSHAWIDFKDYTDEEGVNWFDNSIEASKAHYNFAVAMEDKYITLGPLAWGLTASDGPNGYNGLYGAPPSGFDNRAHFIDDTIAPSGAIGSILFLPEQAQQAMVNYYAIERLNGRYGFLDAYNLTEDWYASDVIGIDKGITLLMLANFEDGLVYQIMMQNETILDGLDRLGLTTEN